ncbi:MAG: M48 family peptidase [Alphaproteobacteria bacterium]|nr:M48 family peptidase [Alphaproteobacteria bacterium]
MITFMAPVLRFIIALCVSVFIGLAGLAPAHAEGRLSLIRDAEIEHTIGSYAQPLFAAAGLDAEAVKIHLVNDPRLNAFVAGGLNLFINTGLLEASETPNEVIGVIAHEIGHIEGGHLIRRKEAMENATAEAILAMVLGTAVAAAGGGLAGAVIYQGGAEMAQNSLLRYSQSQESAADQAGVRYLDQTGQSAHGLLKLFGKLSDLDVLSSQRQSPYQRTHPLTRERMRFVEYHVEGSKFSGVQDPPARLQAHGRMVAKLIGFLETPERVFKLYPATDKSIPARYARAVAYHRNADLPKALAETESLIAEQPDDPYFQELKGQILFERGELKAAVAPYRRAAELAPRTALLRAELGRVLIESGEKNALPLAIENLRVAVAGEPTYAPHWHFLGVALGRNGDFPESSLAFAERAILNGRGPEARFHAEKALKGLPPGTPQAVRAQDIINEADNIKRVADR